MDDGVGARLERIGLRLPPPPAPVGTYASVVVEGTLAWVSGQIVTRAGRADPAGTVDREVDLSTARTVARDATLQGLSALGAALGDVDRVRRIVRVGVFVAASPGFDRTHEVANGATELLSELFGPDVRPARATVGVASLPLGAPVEVELLASVGAR